MTRSALAGLFGLGLLIGVACPMPASALEPAEIRDKIEETFRIYNTPFGEESQKPYRYGSIEAKAAGAGARVTLSSLQMVLDPTQDASIEIGDVSFTMTPEGEAAGEALYRVTDLDMPKRWLLKEGGKTSNVLTFTSYEYDALWSFALLTGLAGNFSAAGIVLETVAGEAAATLDSLRVTLDSKPAEAGRYHLDGGADARGLTIEDEKLRLELKSLGVDFEMPDYGLADRAQIWRQAAQAGKADATVGQAAFAGVLSDIWSQSVNSRIDIAAKGMKGIHPESEDVVEIDLLDIGYGIAEQNDSLSKVDLSLAQSGLRVIGPSAAADSVVAALLPADAAAVLILDRFPLLTVMNLMAPFAQEAAAVEAAEDEVPELPPGVAEEMGLKVLDALVASGTSLDMTGTRIATPESEVTFKGGVIVDPAAVFVARGTVLIEAVGLDSLVKLAQQRMNDPDPKVRESAIGAVGILGMIKTYADRDNGDPDKPVDRFQVELAANGAVTINGQPILPGPPPQ